MTANANKLPFYAPNSVLRVHGSTKCGLGRETLPQRFSGAGALACAQTANSADPLASTHEATAVARSNAGTRRRLRPRGERTVVLSGLGPPNVLFDDREPLNIRFLVRSGPIR
jgi:hypothetical protein